MDKIIRFVCDYCGFLKNCPKKSVSDSIICETCFQGGKVRVMTQLEFYENRCLWCLSSDWYENPMGKFCIECDHLWGSEPRPVHTTARQANNAKRRNRQPITTDEIIDFHLFLKNFDSKSLI